MKRLAETQCAMSYRIGAVLEAVIGSRANE